MNKISIHIVTWNSLKFLPDCLASIYQQTEKNFSVTIIDNASTDKTVEFVNEHYSDVKIIRNNKNLGFAAAHNRAIKIAALDKKTFLSRYILVLNPDIILSSDFLKKTLNLIKKDESMAAVAGKSFKIYTSDSDLNEKIKTEIIDSTGLKIFKSGRVVDRGENQKDKGQYDKTEEVFGLSGSCVLYRLSALEDIKIPLNNSQFVDYSDEIRRLGSHYEYFDEDFFAYKEDADISYRLRWRGWKMVYLPEATIYHYRQVFGGQPKIGETIKRRQKRSPIVRYLSYRNHFFLLTKNLSWSNYFSHFPWILFYELKKFVYILFFEPKTLKGLFKFYTKLPRMFKKRKWIMKNKKINSKEMRKWFS